MNSALRRRSIKIECEYVKGKKSLKEKHKEGILCGKSDVRLALQIAQGPRELMLQNYYLKNILKKYSRTFNSAYTCCL